MKRKLEISELIFKIISYLFLTVFALLCLYPFLYAISASIIDQIDTGTDNIVGAKLLRRMKHSSVLINVGRGNAVDERALASALKSRRIAAAFIDVFKKEPLTSASSLAADLPGLFRFPHASAFSPDYLARFFRELAVRGALK